MNFEDLIAPDRIGCQVQAGGKKRSLEAISELISHGHPSLTGPEVFERLLARERLGSTGMGHGVAIPHGRCPNIQAIRGAFIQLENPIDFDAIDNEPVDLLFALLVPEESDEQHIHVLGQLAGLFRNNAIRESLRTADDAQSIYDILMQAWLAY